MIRNARENDFMACVGISRLAWPDFKERESIFHLLCKHFSNTSFVFEQPSGALSGFVLAFRSQSYPQTLYVHLIAVHPEAQGQGIAKALYAAIFKRAEELGCSQIACIVNPDNAHSVGLHKRLGFVADTSGNTIVDHGEVAARDYNGPGLHMVRFSKSLR